MGHAYLIRKTFDCYVKFHNTSFLVSDHIKHTNIRIVTKKHVVVCHVSMVFLSMIKRHILGIITMCTHFVLYTCNLLVFLVVDNAREKCFMSWLKEKKYL